jgi:hypothetical protein
MTDDTIDGTPAHEPADLVEDAPEADAAVDPERLIA